MLLALVPGMEDEWYSGGDTHLAQGHGGAIAATTTGAAAAKRGPYGDSFTPPTSQSGMAGQQVRCWCWPRPIYLPFGSSSVRRKQGKNDRVRRVMFGTVVYCCCIERSRRTARAPFVRSIERVASTPDTPAL